MSITQFSELAEGRTKTEKAGSTSSPPEHRYGRRFLAKSDDRLELEDNVLAAGGIALGDTHPSFPFARCVGRRADRVPETLYAWHAVYEYTTHWSEIETSDDPSFFRDVVKWSTRFIELPLIGDAISGDAVINTAKDGFDPPIMVEYGLDVVTIEKNYATFPSFLRTTRNTRNLAAVTIRGEVIAAGEGLLKSVEISDELFQNALLYFKATLEIVLDPVFKHQANVLNDGLNELFNGNATDKRRILIKGEPVDRPLPLATDGSVIPADHLPASAEVLEFAKYELASWVVLELPA